MARIVQTKSGPRCRGTRGFVPMSNCRGAGGKRGKCVKKMATAQGKRCAKYAGSKPPRKPCKTTVRVPGYSRKAGVTGHTRKCPK